MEVLDITTFISHIETGDTKMVSKLLKKTSSYLKSFPNIFSENSTKLLTLLISAISGAFLTSVVIPFCLIWDVVINGHITTDLIDLGIFLLCVAAFICGAGYNVRVPDITKYRKCKEKEEDVEC